MKIELRSTLLADWGGSWGLYKINASNGMVARTHARHWSAALNANLLPRSIWNFPIRSVRTRSSTPTRGASVALC
jgi:hypothetical protein